MYCGPLTLRPSQAMSVSIETVAIVPEQVDGVGVGVGDDGVGDDGVCGAGVGVGPVEELPVCSRRSDTRCVKWRGRAGSSPVAAGAMVSDKDAQKHACPVSDILHRSTRYTTSRKSIGIFKALRNAPTSVISSLE